MANINIRANINGEKALVRALNKAPEFFFQELRSWLKNERANFLGGKDAKGKVRRGYRDLLQKKRLRRRPGTWSPQITNLFKGVIPFAKNINDLRLLMGVLGRSKHQLAKALELLATGGTISGRKQMPIPVYKNLAKIGYKGPWSIGNAKSGMKSKAIRAVSRKHGLVAIKKRGKVFYFDPKSKKDGGSGFERSGLMFIGLFGVRVKRQLKGRYDFYGRWDRLQPAGLKRSRTAVDRAIKRIERFT